MYIDTYMRGSGLLSKGGVGLRLSFCPWVLIEPLPWAQQWPSPWALCGSFPTERCEACLERRDEVCDCKLHITQTKDCT